MKNLRIEALIVALGLTLGGFLIYEGFDSFSSRDRTVAVRGFSERVVPADKVIWPIKFKQAGDDLNQLYNNANRSISLIKKFLRQNGVRDSEITVSTPRVQDNWSEGYNRQSDVRHYNISQAVTVTSQHVGQIRPLMNRMQELLRMGVTVSNDYESGVSYDYTKLDNIKPAMVAEATRSARNAAEKFAKDSESNIGKIKCASQGYFSIDDRDENTPYIKKVRVVTSVEYYLKN